MVHYASTLMRQAARAHSSGNSLGRIHMSALAPVDVLFACVREVMTFLKRGENIDSSDVSFDLALDFVALKPSRNPSS